MEYMSINTTHPRLEGLHPLQMADKFLQHKLKKVDFAWSFSSFEHDGLGRYGDPLNPFAELTAS
jgi:hypothetical protein